MSGDEGYACGRRPSVLAPRPLRRTLAGWPAIRSRPSPPAPRPPSPFSSPSSSSRPGPSAACTSAHDAGRRLRLAGDGPGRVRLGRLAGAPALAAAGAPLATPRPLGPGGLPARPPPEALHHWLAPGAAAVWHPDVPAAAAVLGPGPHPVSLYPEATRRWLAFATGVIALALAAGPALRHRHLQIRTSVAVVTGAVLVSAYAFVARLAFGDKLFGAWTVPTVSPFGPFVSKNHFAGYVELTALLALGLAFGFLDEARRGGRALDWMDSPGAWKPLTALGSALALGLAVLLSQSRGGVVSLSMGALALPLLRTHVRGRRLTRGRLGLLTALAAALVASTLMVLPADTRDRLATLARGPSDLSASYRLGVWRDAVHGVGGSPLLGFGLGTFEHALPPFKTSAGELRVEHAENEYVELLLETGGTGLLLNLAALAVLALSVVRGLRSQEERLVRGVGLGAVAGLTALAVHSLGDFNLRIPSNALLASLLAAVGVAAVSSRGAPTASGDEGSTVAPRLLLVALSMSFVMALATPWSEPRWDPATLARATAPGRTDLRRSALESDVTAFLRRRPGQAAAWVQLGWLRLPASREDGSALARWGVALDPRQEELARVSAPLPAGPRARGIGS